MSIRQRTALLILVTCTALTTGVASATQSAAASDVELAPVSPNVGQQLSANISFSQTFTAGRSGVLSKVSLWMTTPGTITSLTVRLFDATVADATYGYLPNLATTPLSSTTLTNPQLTALVPYSRSPEAARQFDVILSPSPTVVAGNRYALVITANPAYANYDGYSMYQGFKWWFSNTYTTNSTYNNGTAWFGLSKPFAFTTFVDAGSDVTSASSSNLEPKPMRTVGLDVGTGSCENVARSAVDGQWIPLPSEAECSRHGHTLLGWSTSTGFPVAVAKAQVDRGWGAIDANFDGGRMIFIPGGGYTLISGDNTLHAVWSPAT